MLKEVISIFLIFSVYLADGLNPVITIPGYGGSQGWSIIGHEQHHLWLNVVDMALSRAYFDQLSLDFDKSTNRTIRKGLQGVIFPGWGDTDSTDNLGSLFRYFSKLTKYLEKYNKYYVKSYTLRSAPYDFRKDPVENAFFVTSLMSLVEETFRIGGKKKVLLISHSMGCIYTHYFLSEMSLAWKEKFIAGWIPISGPFGGAFKSIVGCAIGEAFIPLTDPRPSRVALRTCSSTHLLFPNKLGFDENQILVEIKGVVNITMKNIEKFYQYNNMTEMLKFYNRRTDIANASKAPEGVRVGCVFSNGYRTNKKLTYPDFKSFVNAENYVLETEDADGTVNWDSLMVCTKWNNTKTVVLSGYDHLKILDAKGLFEFVKEFLESL